MSKKTVKTDKTKTRREPSGYIPAEAKPAWLEWIEPEKFNDKDLFRIVTFFVFHSPCVGKNSDPKPLSAMCKPLTDYGWSEKWGNYKNPQSLNYILRNATTNFSLIFSADSNKDLSQECHKAKLKDNFPSEIEQERVAISISDQNQFLSLFRHIRNAFSHTRFNMCELIDGDLMFIMEDISRKYVSARMLLRKSTLLKWIDIIEAGPQPCDMEE
jgi:hypothetical protein